MIELDEITDELEYKIGKLENKVSEILDGLPYFLILTYESQPYDTSYNKEERYVAVFRSKKDVDNFINSCKLKSGKGWKKKSPLYWCRNYRIARHYIPNDIPINPDINW